MKDVRFPFFSLTTIGYWVYINISHYSVFFTVALKQRLHATHNLMELLNAKHPGIPPTLRDDRLSEEVIEPGQSLKSSWICCVEEVVRRLAAAVFLPLVFVSVQAEQLRQHYMTKYDSEVADAHQSLQPVLQNIKELKRKVRSPLTSTLIYSRRYTALLCCIIVCLHILVED